ncbi:MAG TPA: CheR family methyltransferase [Myxococcales bacterium]|jgi:chemotaxis methyl-accepting protein methylase|nr:CheR family methyltransferase [Myxococcales bacterium]
MTQTAIDTLTTFASAYTGFSREAILEASLRKVAEQLERTLGGEAEVLRRAREQDPKVMDALSQAVSVGETFFFRQPEHFRWVAGRLAPIWQSENRTELHAWSAGCATGEEAYSLASCLLEVAPATAQVSVLGTDLVERNLTAAREGHYGSWSRRVSGPMLHQVFVDAAAERASVTQRVRNATRFKLHNLLEPAPGQFDVIFCRNVLVYFSPEKARVVLRNLSRALLPGGALFFGSMDVTQPIPGLDLARPTELQIFWRTPQQLHTPKTVLKPPPPTPPEPFRAAAIDPVALHVQALMHIESGDKKRAQAELLAILNKAHGYLPALLELALLHLRAGEKSAAGTQMREVLRRAEALLPDEIVQGPEPLPASFYRNAAVTYLRAGRGE